MVGVLCQFHKPKGEWTDRPVSKQLCLGIWIFGLWVVVTWDPGLDSRGKSYPTADRNPAYLRRDTTTTACLKRESWYYEGGFQLMGGQMVSSYLLSFHPCLLQPPQSINVKAVERFRTRGAFGSASWRNLGRTWSLRSDRPSFGIAVKKQSAVVCHIWQWKPFSWMECKRSSNKLPVIILELDADQHGR